VRKVARYEMQVSSKAQLLTYVADVPVMSAFPSKADISRAHRNDAPPFPP